MDEETKKRVELMDEYATGCVVFDPTRCIAYIPTIAKSEYPLTPEDCYEK